MGRGPGPLSAVNVTGTSGARGKVHIPIAGDTSSSEQTLIDARNWLPFSMQLEYLIVIPVWHRPEVRQAEGNKICECVCSIFVMFSPGLHDNVSYVSDVYLFLRECGGYLFVFAVDVLFLLYSGSDRRCKRKYVHELPPRERTSGISDEILPWILILPHYFNAGRWSVPCIRVSWE